MNINILLLSYILISKKYTYTVKRYLHYYSEFGELICSVVGIISVQICGTMEGIMSKPSLGNKIGKDWVFINCCGKDYSLFSNISSHFLF